MLMRQAGGFRIHVRPLFRRIFYLLLGRLGIRRLRAHSVFAPLLTRPAAVADFGAHRGEFFAALKSESSISRALLVDANPALVQPLQEAFGNEANVIHAALAGANEKGTITFVNLRIMPPAKRIGFRCRVALANALFIARRLLFGKAAANLQAIGPHCSQ